MICNKTIHYNLNAKGNFDMFMILFANEKLETCVFYTVAVSKPHRKTISSISKTRGLQTSLPRKC